MTTTESQWAWVAGVIEGDGCFTFGEKQPRITIAMTDLDVLERIAMLTGVGRITGPYDNDREGKKGFNILDMYRWNVCKKADIVVILDQIMPWLCQRRAERAMELYKVAQQNLGNGSKVECARGHSIIDDNNVYAWGGRRKCRTCRQDDMKNFYARKRVST